jgi:NADH-quinone oxidoreductase subunit I
MTALPPRARGTLALIEDRCTSCMICVRECPDWSISIEAHQEVVTDPRGGRQRTVNVLDSFTVDWGTCMACGICVDVCPHAAIFWAPTDLPVATTASGVVHDGPTMGGFVPAVPAEVLEAATARTRHDARR